jgi:hypothetical protein
MNSTGNDNTATGFDALLSNTTGIFNTAAGADALFANTTGFDNTATGADALFTNTTGAQNTATGANALFSNTTGFANTATGVNALDFNTTGRENTATGFDALDTNTSGNNNTADGFQALFRNTTGVNNTATGELALSQNTTGVDQTAAGALALQHDTTGQFNSAVGFQALTANTTGSLNTADGVNALLKNNTGGQNSAVGVNAMQNNTTGSNNIAVGFLAGMNLTTGSNNIDIGSLGIAADKNAIRLGRQGIQTAAFIAGVFGSSVTGDAVVISNTGQLGIVKSSARFKRDIRDMGNSSDALMKLRPVTFKYKSDPEGIKQYGLVAEEVARVYPELVSYGADGKLETVRYLTLISMLLNELQKQARQNNGQTERLSRQAQQIKWLNAKVTQVEASAQRELGSQRAAFGERLSALENSMQAQKRNRNLTVAFRTATRLQRDAARN